MKLFKEPFFHFVLIGALLFFAYECVNQTSKEAKSDEIYISPGRIKQIAFLFEKTWQRAPSQSELEALVQDYVLEEIYVRAAKEMGIDSDDAIIRRRLRQKVEFLAADFSSLQKPTDADLQTYLTENPEQFTRNASYHFDQVFINPEHHGEDTDAYIQTALKQLQAGQRVDSDSAMIPSRYESVSTTQLDSRYGRAFTEQLSSLPLREWVGPIQSGLGQHLVRMEIIEPGSLPDWTEIRDELEAEWQRTKRADLREELNQQLIDAYQITIEWPDANKPA